MSNNHSYFCDSPDYDFYLKKDLTFCRFYLDRQKKNWLVRRSQSPRMERSWFDLPKSWQTIHWTKSEFEGHSLVEWVCHAWTLQACLINWPLGWWTFGIVLGQFQGFCFLLQMRWWPQVTRWPRSDSDSSAQRDGQCESCHSWWHYRKWFKHLAVDFLLRETFLRLKTVQILVTIMNYFLCYFLCIFGKCQW